MKYLVLLFSLVGLLLVNVVLAQTDEPSPTPDAPATVTAEVTPVVVPTDVPPAPEASPVFVRFYENFVYIGFISLVVIASLLAFMEYLAKSERKEVYQKLADSIPPALIQFLMTVGPSAIKIVDKTTTKVDDASLSLIFDLLGLEVTEQADGNFIVTKKSVETT